MKVAFFGTSEFGADALDLLVATAGIDVAWVVSQPDRRAGRGRNPQPPPVARRARELGIELIQTDDASASPPPADAGAVVAFGQLVRPPLLHAFPLYNIHPSLLPRWRGAAPVERAIMAGDDTTGVCVIEIAEELDAGPIHGIAPIRGRSPGRRGNHPAAGARARSSAVGRGSARRDHRDAAGRRWCDLRLQDHRR